MNKWLLWTVAALVASGTGALPAVSPDAAGGEGGAALVAGGEDTTIQSGVVSDETLTQPPAGEDIKEEHADKGSEESKGAVSAAPQNLGQVAADAAATSTSDACNGHGVPYPNGGGCSCEMGWTGVDCSLEDRERHETYGEHLNTNPDDSNVTAVVLAESKVDAKDGDIVPTLASCAICCMGGSLCESKTYAQKLENSGTTAVQAKASAEQDGGQILVCVLCLAVCCN